MIERRDDRELLLASDLLRLDAPVLGRAAREYDLAAPFLDACDFHGRRRFGHHDHGAHAELLRGKRYGLAVIPRGKRDDAALARGVGQFADGVVRAADLERADRLLVLELEVRPQFLDPQELRAARDPPQARCGFRDVPGRDHATSWASGLGTWVWAWPYHATSWASGLGTWVWAWPWTSAREPASRRRCRPRRRRPRLPSPRARHPRPGRRASGS